MLRDGTFQPGQAFGTDAAPAGAVLVADFDGDGLPDVLTANRAGGTATVLRGNGDGTFLPAETVATGSTGDPPAADLNGDGLLDLLDATAVRLNLGAW